MKTKLCIGVALCALAAAAIAPATYAQEMKMVSESTVTGFPFPESVGCDAKAKVLYVSQFVSELKPAEKEGLQRQVLFRRERHHPELHEADVE